MTTTFRTEPPNRVGRALQALGIAALAGALMSACSGDVLNVGHDVPPDPPPDPQDPQDPLRPSYATRAVLAGESPAGSGIPTVVATQQPGTPHLVVDDRRIYWTTHGPTSLDAMFDNGQFFLRGCAKDDCRGTLVTYATSAGPIGPIAANGTRLFFSLRTPNGGPCREGCLRSCPAEGCESGSTQTENIAAASLAADESHVYWLSHDLTLQRCPADGCRGLPELLALLELPLDYGRPLPTFMIDATSILWARTGSDFRSRIVELEKSRANPIRDIAGGIAYAMSLAADASRIYWTELAGEVVKSCPRTGCGMAHEAFASVPGFSTLLAVRGGRVYWFSGPSQWYRHDMPVLTDLLECPSSGCGASPKRVIAAQTTPCAIAVDDTHVYWRTGIDRHFVNWDYSDGTLLRIKR